MGKRIYPTRNCKTIIRTLQEFIVKRRKQLGLSQEALAARCRLSRNCIQQLECKEHIPNIVTFFLVIDALEVSDDELYYFVIDARRAYCQDKESFLNNEERVCVNRYRWVANDVEICNS